MASGEEFPGLRVGLEIHQQISSTSKLFCSCPPVKSEELPYSFERRLRPAQSELGRIDPAAVFEYSKGKKDTYFWSPESSCLVEADEEPPHPVKDDALETTMMISAALGSNPVDEVHVMRKIVIDGSNTAGFQRTAIVGLGGAIQVEGVRVGVQSVTLEEDAARILGEESDSRRFGLDRLGTPLVEVALDPVSGGPALVGKVALHLGRTLRSTGRVARGLGTIRQDLNISIKGGRVVEVKGVQKLSLVPRVVEYEARRQLGLEEVGRRIRSRGLNNIKCEAVNVTKVIGGSGSPTLERLLSDGNQVQCVIAAGLKGMMGWEPNPEVRLGREVADVARANSLGGVIHSDEFERQGISLDVEKRLRNEIGAQENDALVLVAGTDRVLVNAVPAIIARIRAALQGAPAETRAATEDGETRYMRPRPGAQRMYPETDIPAIRNTSEIVRRLSKAPRERWEDKVARFSRDYSLSGELALKVYDSDHAEAFESLSREMDLEPSVVASMLVETPVRLAREGIPETALALPVLTEVLKFIDSGKVAKEAGPDILRAVGSKDLTVQRAIDSLRLKALGESDIEKEADAVITRHAKLVRERGLEAFSPLMGEIMKRLRGRADGAMVGRILMERLREAVGQDPSLA